MVKAAETQGHTGHTPPGVCGFKWRTGDPDAPAREVINCHCILIPGVLLPGEKLGEDGEIVENTTLKSQNEHGIINWEVADFTGEKALSWHYNKHKAGFPGITEGGYLSIARGMMKQTLEKGVLEEVRRADGGVARYDFRNNIFVATTNDGRFRTLMKPIDKEAYWEYEHERNK